MEEELGPDRRTQAKPAPPELISWLALKSPLLPSLPPGGEAEFFERNRRGRKKGEEVGGVFTSV